MIWHTKLKRYKRSFRTDAWSKSSGQQGRGSRSQFLRIQSFIGNKNTFITTYLTMGSNVRYKRCETIWWWSYLVGSSWWTKVILIYHRGVYLTDGHLVRIPHEAVKRRRPSDKRTPLYELTIISISVSHVRHHQHQAKVWLVIKEREIQEKKKLKIEPIPI